LVGNAATVDESIPPDSNIPSGTSDTSRIRTASDRRSRSLPAADYKLKFVAPAPLEPCDKLKFVVRGPEFVVESRSQYLRDLISPFSTTIICAAGSLLTLL